MSISCTVVDDWQKEARIMSISRKALGRIGKRRRAS